MKWLYHILIHVSRISAHKNRDFSQWKLFSPKEELHALGGFIVGAIGKEIEGNVMLQLLKHWKKLKKSIKVGVTNFLTTGQIFFKKKLWGSYKNSKKLLFLLRFSKSFSF